MYNSPGIKTLSEKKLVGKRLTMSLTDNRTADLWRSFIPARKGITNNLGTDLISMQIYKPHYFADFKPTNEFEKWATVEVSDFENVPAGMEAFTLPAGLYAVFHYKGLNTDSGIFEYIFGAWLPNAPYVLDDRPHFEVLGEKYKNNDPASEEEIWIPVKAKHSIETREEMIAEYIRAYNNFDIDKMLANLAETVRFENVSGGVTNMRLTGLAAFREQAEKASGLFVTRKQTPKSFTHNGEHTEVEIDYAGVLAIDLPDGMKKGDALSVQGKSIFQFAGSRIVSITDVS
jgi:AraC family transcriptional regulator